MCILGAARFKAQRLSSCLNAVTFYPPIACRKASILLHVSSCRCQNLQDAPSAPGGSEHNAAQRRGPFFSLTGAQRWVPGSTPPNRNNQRSALCFRAAAAS
ncbi:hypothetical protein WMY93_032001 [Mugilogobius chulae]|uniref:Uncharacterized protein n=1 Tax=Mugilogobius chulae TaxID=88201 RepID=A0AAW0MKI5_9GOBI